MSESRHFFSCVRIIILDAHLYWAFFPCHSFHLWCELFSSSPSPLNLIKFVFFFFFSNYFCELHDFYAFHFKHLKKKTKKNLWKTTVTNEVTNMWYILLIKNALKFTLSLFLVSQRTFFLTLLRLSSCIITVRHFVFCCCSSLSLSFSDEFILCLFCRISTLLFCFVFFIYTIG